MTTIGHTEQPLYAVHIVCEGKQIGETLSTADQDKAKDQHAALKRAYPDSRLMIRLAGGMWQEADDAALRRITYERTYAVLGEIFSAGLPLLSWEMKEWAPGELKGSLHGYSEQEARSALTDYILLFNADDFDVQEHDRGLNLHLKVTWHGVKIEVSAYVAQRRVVAEAAEQPAGVPA